MTYKTAQNNTTDLYSRMGLAKQSNFPITFRENTVKIWVHGLLPLKDINIKNASYSTQTRLSTGYVFAAFTSIASFWVEKGLIIIVSVKFTLLFTVKELSTKFCLL